MALELSTLLDRVDGKRRRLFSFRPMPASIIARVKRKQDLAWLHASHGWGGGTLRLGEIESVIDTGLAVAGHPVSEHLEVQNLAEALEWIEEWARADLPMRARDILHVHAVLHAGLAGTLPGRFRASELRVGGTFAGHTPGPEIPRRIQALCTQLNGRSGRKTHPIDRAVHAMITLTMLMPFREGNDLVTRLVLNGLLLQRAYPIAHFPDPDRLRDCLHMAQGGQRVPLTNLVAEVVEAGLDRYLAALA